MPRRTAGRPLHQERLNDIFHLENSLSPKKTVRLVGIIFLHNTFENALVNLYICSAEQYEAHMLD